MQRTNSGYKYGNWHGQLGAGLSPREVQSLLLVADGQTYKQGAQVLGVAPSTFNDRVSNILYKLRVARATQAVAEAIRKGIITPLMLLVTLTLSNAVVQDMDIRRSTRSPARRGQHQQNITIS